MIYVLKNDIANDVIMAKESSAKNEDKIERSWNAVASGIANERLIEKLTDTSFVNLDYNIKKNYSESDMLPAGYDIGVKGKDRDNYYWFGKLDFNHPQFLVEKTEVIVPTLYFGNQPAYAIKRLWLYTPDMYKDIIFGKDGKSDKEYIRKRCNMKFAKKPLTDIKQVMRVLDNYKL